MIDRPSGGDAAVLVALDFGVDGYSESIEELRLLASSAGLDVRALVQGRRNSPDPALFAGSGKAQEIKAAIESHEATLCVFNHALSPAQERNCVQPPRVVLP